jgi:hypothetical protein
VLIFHLEWNWRLDFSVSAETLISQTQLQAEICFPEDEGIVQVEYFGIHVSTRGYVVFGLHLDSIMTRTAESIPIDLLTRMAVDVVQDTSKILGDQTLIMPHE